LPARVPRFLLRRRMSSVPRAELTRFQPRTAPVEVSARHSKRVTGFALTIRVHRANLRLPVELSPLLIVFMRTLISSSLKGPRLMNLSALLGCGIPRSDLFQFSASRSVATRYFER
jgi:hypothetical protein